PYAWPSSFSSHGWNSACSGPSAAGLDQRIERMTERLELSPEQSDEIRTILEAQRAQAEQQRQETQARIQAILTPEQLDRIDERRAARMEAHLERLARRLDLNAEQIEQVRSVLEAKHADPDMSRDEIRAGIAGILSEDQRAVFERAGMRSGRGGPCAHSGVGKGASEIAF
ncbi:MAG: hypothetical protein EOM91_23010, partial [Sphingobacteriia bacterium]|nr:hypothetical protein [Sphingobacteriia bacterium]